MRTTTLTACSLVVALSACGDATSAASDWAGSVTDSAGVAMVTNPSSPSWSEAEAWGTEVVLRIGEAAGDADYQFGQIAGIGVTSNGHILVLDQQAQRVQVYGPDGTYQSSIGRPGSGPGEFGPAASALFVGRGDTLIIPDVGNQRVNVTVIDGESTSFAIQMEQGIPMRYDLFESGDLVAQRRALNLPNQDAVTNDLIATQGYDGTILDTLLTPKRGDTFTFTSDRPQFHIFAPEPMWTTLSGNRLAFATNDSYRIEVFSSDGSLERVVANPYEPTPVTESHERTLVDLMRTQFERNGVPPAQADLLMDGVSFADNWPAFTQMRAGPAGTLWVQRVRYLSDLTEEELESYNPTLDQGSPQWDVFDSAGRYLGIVELPDRFTPFTVDGDRWYGVVRDDFDVQYVQVLRITGAAAGSS
ncbi:MAG: 6-bladed beta-propeller [Gemmatimonadota bacterium]